MSDDEQLDSLAGIDDSLIAHLTKNGYALTEYKIYFEGKQEEGMRDIIGVTALQTLLSWHQQELERAVAKAYRKGYQAGWSTGDSGGRTTKREEVKAKREAWISKKMKEGQS